MGEVETLAIRQGNPVYIANDAVSLYWTNHSTGTIMRLAKERPRSGCRVIAYLHFAKHDLGLVTIRGGSARLIER